MINILGKTLEEFQSLLSPIGIKPFVAKQIFDWIYNKHVLDFHQMKNISKENQEKLKTHFSLSAFKSVKALEAGDHTARKYMMQLNDGQMIESVVLREKTYNTLCVSSQCGCPVDCKFCLTGVVGFKRQLTAAEIVGQVLYANQDGQPISNLVFMGMGEPLMNFDEVMKAIQIITAEYGLNISRRKITVSTSGYLAGIKRLLKEKIYLNLAFSVGHANPLKRVQLMPIENRNPLVDVLRALHDYLSKHNRKLTLEYTLLEGKNDDDQAILELGNMAMYLNSKINLINLNPHHKIPFKPVDSEKLRKIKSMIYRRGIPVTVRFRKGQDIAAACGQLGESHLK